MPKIIIFDENNNLDRYIGSIDFNYLDIDVSDILFISGDMIDCELKKALEKYEPDVIKTNQRLQSGGQYVMINVLKYIDGNFHHHISLKDAADYACVSSSYLSFLFKKCKGINFSDYVAAKRMEYAKELLKDPRYKVYEISRAVGYTDPGYFSVIFKKHEGISPCAYRNSLVTPM